MSQFFFVPLEQLIAVVSRGKEELRHCPGVILPTITPGNTHVWHHSRFAFKAEAAATQTTLH